MKTISYADALKFGGFSIVLCNNVPNITKEGEFCFWDGEEYHSEMWDGDMNEVDKRADFWETEDVYQYYVTSANKDDVKYLCERFSDMHFKYSYALDCWVLMVTHFGTCWSGVMIEDRKDREEE